MLEMWLEKFNLEPQRANFIIWPIARIDTSPKSTPDFQGKVLSKLRETDIQQYQVDALNQLRSEGHLPPDE